jgi:hypothetical protein
MTSSTLTLSGLVPTFATKDEINAAVEKLFRTGQALYLSNVEPERLVSSQALY